MTAKTWTPPPKMPADLPPLPMGRNGRPLVYCGKSYGKKVVSFRGYLTTNEPSNRWLFSDYWVGGDPSRHYAAESDSEVCRMNGWGDFAPEAQKEPVNAAPSTLHAYLEAIEKAIQEADQEWQKAVIVAAAWSEELSVRREIRDCLHGSDTALTRRQWYEQGRKDERHHAKVRTNFPLSP